jgi:hypothetical protein
MDNNLQNNTVVQPSANPSTGQSASSPDGGSVPAVNDLGVNEAVNLSGFPSVGGGRDASMTIAQPAGGPIVTTETAPN